MSRAEYEKEVGYNGKEKALKRLLVCSLAGHDLESNGMKFYRCQRCSKRKESYKVNLGYI